MVAARVRARPPTEPSQFLLLRLNCSKRRQQHRNRKGLVLVRICGV